MVETISVDAKVHLLDGLSCVIVDR
jgi:hypothetical protein